MVYLCPPHFGYKVLRETENPHKSGKIPFIIKYALPLMDSFYGLGDFQRHKPIQFAKDGLTNFYFEGIKMNIYPPTVVNANGIVKHTVSQTPGAIWEETIPNSARRLETSTAGLSTYQSAITQLNAALHDQAGTTHTAINAERALDPGWGKTPEALKQRLAKESTRDNQDRFFFEQALEELLDGMLGLIPEVATENIPIDIFSGEIEEIVESGYGDVLDVVKKGKQVKNEASAFQVSESGESAKLVVNPKGLKGVTYRFNLDAGTTAKSDKDEQRQSLIDFLGVLGKFTNELQALRESEGLAPDWGFIFNQYGILANVPSMDKFFKPVPPPTPSEAQPQPQGEIAPPSVNGMQFQDPELAQIAQQLTQMGGLPGGQ